MEREARLEQFTKNRIPQALAEPVAFYTAVWSKAEFNSLETFTAGLYFSAAMAFFELIKQCDDKEPWGGKTAFALNLAWGFLKRWSELNTFSILENAWSGPQTVTPLGCAMVGISAVDVALTAYSYNKNLLEPHIWKPARIRKMRNKIEKMIAPGDKEGARHQLARITRKEDLPKAYAYGRFATGALGYAEIKSFTNGPSIINFAASELNGLSMHTRRAFLNTENGRFGSSQDEVLHPIDNL